MLHSTILENHVNDTMAKTSNRTEIIIEAKYPVQLNLDSLSHKAFQDYLEPPYKRSEWIVCEVMLLLCAVCCAYILFALLYFYRQQPKRTKSTGRRTGSRWLEKMCILSAVVAFLRMGNNQALLYAGWQSPERCSVLLNVSIALYFCALYPRIFYSNRALKHLYGCGVRFLSWATILCFFLVTGVSMVMFVVDNHNSASGRVCLQNRVMQWKGFTDQFYLDYGLNHTISWQEWQSVTSNRTLVKAMPLVLTSTAIEGKHYHGLKVNTIAGLMAGGMQISFLILFLYPIMDNKLREVRNKNLRCHHSLMKLIRRAFVLSGVCIVSDVTIALAVGSLHTAYPEAVFAPLVIYDINLLINIVCIISTFRRWRGMLVPCYFFYCYTKGKSLLRGSSNLYYIARRSTALEETNELPKRCHREYEMENYVASNIQPPRVDVLLDSDDEDSSNEYLQSNNGNEAKDVRRYSESHAKECSKCTDEKSPTHKINRDKCTRKTVHGARYQDNIFKHKAVLKTNNSSISPFITSRVSLRAKSKNNIVTTKIVLKSEMWMGESADGAV